MILALLILILAILLFGSSAVLGAIGAILGFIALLIGLTLLIATTGWLTGVDPGRAFPILILAMVSLIGAGKLWADWYQRKLDTRRADAVAKYREKLEAERMAAAANTRKDAAL